MGEFWQTILLACIPSIITGIATFFVASRSASAQIKVVTEQNKHDLEKLMQQHQIDIENIKEKHKLEIEAKEVDYKYKLELQQREFENALQQRKIENDNSMAMASLQGLLGLIGTTYNNALSTPEGKQKLGELFKNVEDEYADLKNTSVQEN